MATTRDEQAAQTRDKLLASARRLFAEKGFDATSVREINREIGMADGILYHYFSRGKDEMLATLVREGFAAGFLRLSGMNEDLEQAPLEEAMERIYSVGDEIFTEGMDLLRIVLRERSRIAAEDLACLTDMLNERVEWFARFLERRFEKGEIRKMDFLVASKQFQAMSINNVIGKVLRIDFFSGLSDPLERNKIVQHTLESWR
jgi:Transcriptional regulator